MGKQRQSGSYWVCDACGSWMWASRACCFKCQAKSPKWAVEQGKGKLADGDRSASSHAPAAVGANGNKPKTITIGDFTLLVQGGKKAQREIRNKMRDLQSRASGSQSSSGGVDVAEFGNAERDTSMADVADAAADAIEVDDPILALSDEQLSVQLANARALAECPTFASGLALLEAEKMRRDAARVAAKPLNVRLFAACRRKDALDKREAKLQSQLANAEAADKKAAARATEIVEAAQMEAHKVVEDAAAATASLRASLAEISGKIEANRRERAQIELEDGASANVPLAHPVDEVVLPAQAAADAAMGLWQQLEALPAAVSAGNSEAALAAIRQQLQDVLGGLHHSMPSVGHRPPGTEEAVQEMVAEAQQLRRRRARSADLSDRRGVSRSRSDERVRR
jgi:hypothetical protein